MARKRKSKVSPGGIALWVALILLALAGMWAWQHRARVPAAVATIARELPAPAPSAGPPPSGADAAVAAKVGGKLVVRRPPRDARIGVSADAAVLLRVVEMYQWHERCELDGGACSYEKSWSPGRVDSGRFRAPAGHENPPAPFADARFVAGEIRLGDLVVDPKLLDAQAAKDYPVKESALPPNLAATFSVVDGVLYAGGDAAHPQIGTVRVRYRIVPAGEVELAGVKRGNKLEAK
ncbi:MAG: TMEM43 family protein [Rudaea sp.]|uniref:TMEM43 family protein n=1 Tax=Rudaea sp. TaxID=2136325 RepID=UPI0039E4D01D